MAKAKVPKKNGELKPEIVTQTPQIAASGNGNGSVEPILEKETLSTRKAVRRNSRASLIPSNVEEEVRQLAYLLSERRGFEPGHETEDWLAAEHEVRDRYHQPGA